MDRLIRKAFPFLAMAACGVALVYAISFGQLPPADLSYNNGDEIATVDPAKATGEPEGRIIGSLFEGLLSSEPAADKPGEDGLVPYEPKPAAAESYDVSPDGLIYTFHIRRDARWTDGAPVRAEDFRWSWRRMLHPETASKYAFQLHYIRGAQDYNELNVSSGMKVEIELDDRPNKLQQFPSGTMLYGILKEVIKPSEPKVPANADEDAKNDLIAKWKREWEFAVEVKPERPGGGIDWEATGKSRRFTAGKEAGGLEKCKWVLPSFDDTVGVRVEGSDGRTLVVALKASTPFFKHLVSFYPLYPVNRKCLEEHGAPFWTEPSRIVTNGPMKLEFRRLRDRVRLVKNEDYWGKERVKIGVVDALAIKQDKTAFNMYESRQLDWTRPIPNTAIPVLKSREDYVSAPMLSIYFFRISMRKKPLDDVRVRQAISMALDRESICTYIAKAGQIPAYGIVPPGMAGYKPADGLLRNVERAKKFLEEAGFPGGRGFPPVKLLYNTSEGHRDIAEVVQSQLRENLGITLTLENKEWNSYLADMNGGNYEICRGGWVGDYPDPNTFLDLWVTDGQQNGTGWGNKDFDEAIRGAGKEIDPVKRMKLLQQAEAIANRELPIVPIYFYVSLNLVRPYVKGFVPNLLDHHPLHLLDVDRKAQERFRRTGVMER